MSETLSIDLNDDLTLGTLRAAARTIGAQLVVSFGAAGVTVPAPASQPARKRGRPAKAGVPVAAKAAPTKRRPLSVEAREKLAANLAKARAVRLAKLKAAKRT